MGKKILRWTLRIVGALVALVAAFCAFIAIRGVPKYDPPKLDVKVAITPEKVQRGKRIATAACINCHRDPVTGKLSGRVIHDVPPIFGTVVSRNISADKSKGIGGWSDGEIAGTIRTGITHDGLFSPVMGGRPLMADADIEDVIAWLRTEVEPVPVDPPGRTEYSFLVKFLTNVAVKPPPLPKAPIARPPESDAVALGRYLVTGAYGCFGCHSEDFATTNHLEPEKTPGYFGGGNKLIALGGGNIFSANLTPDDATGIGTITKEQFRRALLKGIGFNNKPLRAPMGQFVGLTETEADAIYAYLRTVPKISKNVDRRWREVPAGDPGRAAYVAQACDTCHGDDGVGYFSIKRVNEAFPSDDALKAFIENPQKDRPLAAMPVYEGVIDAQQMSALIKYVRSFGSAKP
jgi:mono/diheme cytochrome c family protein